MQSHENMAFYYLKISRMSQSHDDMSRGYSVFRYPPSKKSESVKKEAAHRSSAEGSERSPEGG